MSEETISCLECGSQNVEEFKEHLDYIFCKRCGTVRRKCIGTINRKTDVYIVSDGNENYHTRHGQRADIKSVVYKPPFTIIKWSDGETTKVKISGDDDFRKDYGLAMAVCRRLFGRAEFLRLVENAVIQEGTTLKEYEKKMEERRKKKEKAEKKALKLSKK
jgi:hypothetical protein